MYRHNTLSEYYLPVRNIFYECGIHLGPYLLILHFPLLYQIFSIIWKIGNSCFIIELFRLPRSYKWLFIGLSELFENTSKSSSCCALLMASCENYKIFATLFELILRFFPSSQIATKPAIMFITFNEFSIFLAIFLYHIDGLFFCPVHISHEIGWFQRVTPIFHIV